MKRKVASQEEFASSNEEKEKTFSLRKFIFLHWVPLLLTLIIIIATVIIVPIVYSIRPSGQENKNRTYLWNTTGQTILTRQIRLNDANQTLGNVSSLFFASNSLYILEKSTHRLIRWDNQSSMLTLLVGNLAGSSGSDSSSLNQPNDVFVDSNLNIYIADTGNNRIQYFHGTSSTGETLNLARPLAQPMSVTMDEENDLLYIADYGHNRIVRYNVETRENIILINSNTNGPRNTYLINPNSIRYDRQSSSLLIAQETSFNVVRWSIGASAWNLTAGSRNSDLSGTSRTLFNELCSINLDQSGNIYVVDCNNQRIQFFSGDLTKGRSILGVTQASGNNSCLFSRPTAIAFDSMTNIFVADSLNYRIQFFPMI